MLYKFDWNGLDVQKLIRVDYKFADKMGEAANVGGLKWSLLFYVYI